MTSNAENTVLEMYSCEGWQNAAKSHHAYVLPVKVINVPNNATATLNVLRFTAARNHDLRTLLAEVMEAAQIERVRYSFEGEIKTAYAG